MLSSPGLTACLPVRLLIALAVISQLPSVSLAQQSGTLSLPGTASAEGQARGVNLAASGPWGALEYYHTYLEAPEHLVEMMTLPSEQTEWKFNGVTLANLEKILRDAGLTEEQFAIAMEPPRRIETESQIRLFPTPELVISLSPETRTRLYTLLGNNEENRYHFKPITFEENDLRTWFAGSDISEEAIQTVGQLVWRRDNVLLFSDIPYLLRSARSPRDEMALMQALTRTRTLILRLRLSPESDLRVLGEYWTGGHRHQDILPLLESVIRTEGVERLDVTHLLPPLPRKHLYAFPSPLDGLSGRYPDAFWTAVNFFSFYPRNQYQESPGLDSLVRSEYAPTQPPFRFGDLLFVARQSDRQAVHVCVYIADDIVYTKNSADVFTPWIFMKLDDMLAHHRRGQPIFINGWRNKNSRYSTEAPFPASEKGSTDAANGVLKVP